MRKQYISILPLLFLLFAVGCGTNVQLGGKVTYEDGTPLSVGTVNFSDGKSISKGDINSDGTYKVGTLKDTDGIPPGTYKVYLTGTQHYEEVPGPDGKMVSKYTDTIPSKYSNGDTSGWTFVVDGKTKTYDIKVERSDAQ